MYKHKDLKEVVLCAAIWFPNENTPYHNVKNIDKGLVLCGHRHPHIIGQYNAMGGKFTEETYVQGFITNLNNFLTREEAHTLFIDCGGEPESSEQLYSEDLY